MKNLSNFDAKERALYSQEQTQVFTYIESFLDEDLSVPYVHKCILVQHSITM